MAAQHEREKNYLHQQQTAAIHELKGETNIKLKKMQDDYDHLLHSSVLYCCSTVSCLLFDLKIRFQIARLP